MSEEGLEKYTFSLSTEDDEELIEELDRAKEGGRLNEHICNLLRLGHNVHLAATFSTNQESLKSLMTPIDERVSTLSEIVDRLVHGTFTSSTKGSIGEQIIS